MSSYINYFVHPTTSMPIQVSLRNLPVFESFYPSLLEQVTGSGRFFCPHPKFSFSGMEESSKYQLSLRFDRMSDNKFQFKSNGEWEVDETKRQSKSEKEDPIFLHPDITTGSELMSRETEFIVPITHRPEVKNTKHLTSKAVALETCVKYQPVLIVAKIPENGQMGIISQEFKFDCLAFMAVCRYRNSRVSAIKSELNGYAKSADKRRISRMNNKDKQRTPATLPMAESVNHAPQPSTFNHAPLFQAQAPGHPYQSPHIPNFQEHYPFPSNENFYHPVYHNTSYSSGDGYPPVFDQLYF
ncbi:Protein CBR-TBX-35 [Caenorhabditis briggsae]|uniref:Protein CBR-TBX-35 n=1 Tax=Caenorhabditis briggsae TaxID=6238 RepID=A8WQC7_CAEBR|nr:Protein CBR-TBX-35 [Caenorhabditis briggsae]CAP22685.2 Protein CBR-TBX-35 [Caenorhabditis briggsae]